MVYTVTKWSKEQVDNLDVQFEKSTALRFLTHIIGDIHQPLHAAALFNDQFPNGDQGGNLFKIVYPDNKEINGLHKFFDSGAAKLPELKRVNFITN